MQIANKFMYEHAIGRIHTSITFKSQALLIATINSNSYGFGPNSLVVHEHMPETDKWR